MAGVLFEDIFDVKDIDPDGKKFQRGLYYIIFGIIVVATLSYIGCTSLSVCC